MKSYPIILFLLLAVFAVSCTDNLSDIGLGIQPSSDQISVKPDTFHLTSETVKVQSILSKPDSFLLGSYNDKKFGSTKAEILAQLNCPEGFKFPANAIADSASIVLYYRTWFGNESSLLHVNIFEMNKAPLVYPNLYYTNIDPSLYTDQKELLGDRIFSAKDASKLRADSTSIIFKLDSKFVTRFKDDTNFASTEKFLNFFKGIYITADFGSATLLNISQIHLKYYYHYTYNTKSVITGKDSIATVNNNIDFPANSEVRQVNRILHLDRDLVVNPAAGVNYVAAPANLNTHIGIPLFRINTRMKDSIPNKEININSAILKVEATNIDVDTTSTPTVRYMLLIKESAVDRFFKNKELPSDTCAMLGSHSIALIVNTTNQYEDYYTFSLAKLIANELKVAKQFNTIPVDKLKMVLIPVQVTFDSNSNPTAVKQSNSMSAVTIRSGTNTESPMRLNLVYSGF